jgi:RHS repeat-associated protein
MLPFDMRRLETPQSMEVISSHSRDFLIRRQCPMGNIMFLLQNISNVATGVEKYTYDAFGGPAITDWSGNPRTESNCNRFMFTGREYLAKLGIYDYRNRAYHPGLGRFLQTDPIRFSGGDSNLFRYCENNPVRWSDPSGLATNDPNPGKGTTKKKENAASGGTDTMQYGVSPGAPMSTQGWWSSPSGLLTNVPGGQLNAAGTPQGGRDNAGAVGFSYGAYRSWFGTPFIDSEGTLNFPVHVEWDFGANPSGDFGFRPGDVSKLPSMTAFLGTFLNRAPSPETAAWTDKGRVPTLVATGVIFAPMALPASFAEAVAALTMGGSALNNAALYWAATPLGSWALMNQEGISEFATNLFNVPAGPQFFPNTPAGAAGMYINYQTGWGLPDR